MPHGIVTKWLDLHFYVFELLMSTIYENSHVGFRESSKGNSSIGRNRASSNLSLRGS